MSAEQDRQQYPPAEAAAATVAADEDPKGAVWAPDMRHVVGRAFDPYRVLLRRLFFLSDDRFKYVSVGYYPARDYRPFVEFGGAS
jgi:hypothetical protein